MKALNPNIKNLDNDNLNIISKNSLIREKIKEKEILKYIKQIELDEKFLNSLIEQRYSRLNLNNKSQFINYIKDYNLNLKILKKISIETLWNRLFIKNLIKMLKLIKKN